jgi:hypothetical protein
MRTAGHSMLLTIMLPAFLHIQGFLEESDPILTLFHMPGSLLLPCGASAARWILYDNTCGHLLLQHERLKQLCGGGMKLTTLNKPEN